MSLASVFRRPLLAAVLVVLFAAGCGGDDDGGGRIDPFQDNQDDGNADASGQDNGSDDGGSGGESNGGGPAGDPELTAEPGQAWVEVDGIRLEYEASGSLFYSCDIGAEQIVVNTQTPGGHDFLLNGSQQGGTWFGRVTFFRYDDDTRIQYSGNLFDEGNRLGASETAIDFEGTVTRIEGTDLQGAEDLDARLAVNCDTGPAPVAQIDGRTIEIPLSGAQAVTCEVSEDTFEIDIGPHQDGRGLEINGRTEGDIFLGSVSIRTAEANYLSTVPDDREGLEVDGNTIRYTGTFENRSTGEELEGSVEAGCP